MKRLISVYKAIADDHGHITLVRIDKRPSRTQKALRQGAIHTEDVQMAWSEELSRRPDLASSILSQSEDTTMASSTNEPTAQEKAARKE